MTSTFLLHLLAWTGALMGAQVVLGAAGGEPELSHVPAWAGFALVLAAYPAGIAVSDGVLGAGPASGR